MVSQFIMKEDEYRKCQYDLVDQIDKHDNLETLSAGMSISLKTSQRRVDQLSTQIEALKADRAHLSDNLEALNQWVETHRRRSIRDTVSWHGGLSRTKARSVAYTRSIAATATSQIDRAAGQLGNRLSTVKRRIDRTLHQSRPGRLLNKSYCIVWKLIGMVYKKAATPQSCSINRI